MRDREVFVVARVGDQRRSFRRVAAAHADAGEIVLGKGWLAPRRDRVAHLQVQAVAFVELRRGGILRAGSVQRVEIETRRASLKQLSRRDVLPQHHVRLVEREVMIDELAQVREPGRHPGRRRAGAGRDRGSDLPQVRVAELAPDTRRPHPRKPKRWRRCRR